MHKGLFLVSLLFFSVSTNPARANVPFAGGPPWLGEPIILHQLPESDWQNFTLFDVRVLARREIVPPVELLALEVRWRRDSVDMLRAENLDPAQYEAVIVELVPLRTGYQLLIGYVPKHLLHPKNPP